MTKSNGFTLIELIVTIAIAAILITVGVPSLLTIMQNNRMTANLNDFVTDLNLARSEAVKRGIRVTICKSADQVSCTTEGDWSQGWIVFSDPNNSGTYNSGGDDETLLKVHAPLENSDASLTGNSQVADYISYINTGITQRVTGSFQNGTLAMCDGRGDEYAKTIVINKVGRLSLQPAAAGDCPES